MVWWNNLRLKSKDPRTRIKAIETLVPGDPRSFELLVAGMGDTEFLVRCAAARGLGALQEEQAVEPLTAGLHDPQPEVRAAAATALGHQGDTRCIGTLVSALKDPHPAVRTAAGGGAEASGLASRNTRGAGGVRCCLRECECGGLCRGGSGQPAGHRVDARHELQASGGSGGAGEPGRSGADSALAGGVG